MDRYDLQARHLPVAVTLLPIVVLAVATIPDLKASLWVPAIGAVGLSGVFWLLSRYARERGRNLEKRLHESWGGLPTTTLLRHRDHRLNPHTKAVYHDRLRKLGKAFKIPSADEEAQDPGAADARYAAAMDELRVRAKASENPIVHRENINYGGARNLLALKALGIVIAAISLAVLIAVIGERCQWFVGLVRMMDVVFTATLVADLLGWIFIVKPSLVRHQADAYAYALIESASDGSRPKRVSRAASPPGHGG